MDANAPFLGDGLELQDLLGAGGRTINSKAEAGGIRFTGEPSSL
jgi:hypothetical protein